MFPDISGGSQAMLNSGKYSRDITSPTVGTMVPVACAQKCPFPKLNLSPFTALPKYLKIPVRKTDERFPVDQEKSLIRP